MLRDLIARIRQNLWLAGQRRDELQSMARLLELSTRLTASPDLQSVLYEVLDATMELQGADFGNVQLFDEATATLKIAAHRGFSRVFLDYFETVDAADSAASGRALRAGTRIIIEDVKTDQDYEPHRAIAASTGYRGVQSTPLVHRGTGKPVGMLTTYFRKSYKPSERELQLTDLYARQAADVIAFRLAEQRIRESESRLQAAVDLAKIGCYSWNPQTNELEWDETVKAIWGLAPDTLVTYDIWRAGVHPGDIERIEEVIRRCADPRGDGIYDVEYRIIRRNDRVERRVATRGKILFENGKAVWFYGVALDISERKRIERRLERRVEARTRELEKANRELRAQIQQRHLAEATVEQLQRLDAIGQITSGVAHDFNNLLSVVLTNAHLLSLRGLEAHDQEGVDLIRTAAERGVKLTAQLLAFSRQQQLAPQIVDLNSKISGLTDLLNITLPGTMHLGTELAADLWPAMADPTQIDLVVLNLVINARDAMPSGGTVVLQTFNASIEREPSRPEEPLPGQYAVLAVIDTGTGIANDVLARVLEPFFTTKGPGKGSGLGLSQVFGFAKQSGGGLQIQTRLGEGTSVKLFLPRAVDAEGNESSSVQGRQRLATERKVMILVVDDDRTVLTTTLRMVRSLGHRAVEAETAREALRLVENEAGINLVLVDFSMPETNGMELARAIQSIRPTLPTIIVTGNGGLDILSGLGESAILQKPFSESDLVARINAALA